MIRKVGGWCVGGVEGMWVDGWLVLKHPEEWGLNCAQGGGHGEKPWFERHIGAAAAGLGEG